MTPDGRHDTKVNELPNRGRAVDSDFAVRRHVGGR